MSQLHSYRRFKILVFGLLIGIILSPGLVQAQVSPQFYDYPNNHLDWFTIESDHFLVHYQEGSSRSAQVISRIAEEVYKPITELYRHEPATKVSIVLRDREDYANGAAYFFDNKIEIWLPALDTPLRGTNNWLRNVITHEFTHIVQLQASMKRSRSIPAIYMQWLSYEQVRRPDVLYGFPNGIITLPFATVGITAWFAEGTAQYQRSGLMYDYWDSHRDMILRTRILDDNYLPFTMMGTFTSKTSLERETVYNQGYAFIIYLVIRFGEEVIADISHAAANSGKNDFSLVMKAATGVSGQELFDDFIREQKEFYRIATEALTYTETEVVDDNGFFNFYPIYSPTGNRFAYLSNKGRDYARTSLIIKDKDGRETSLNDMNGYDLMDRHAQYQSSHGMASNTALDFISNRFSFSPDGNFIAYSRSRKNKLGETYQDLYTYDIETEEKKQLTQSARIQDPAWSLDGKRLAAVQINDGTQNLVIYHFDADSVQQITDFNSGETIYAPVWHPNGSDIYFASASLTNREIWVVNTQSGMVERYLYDDIYDYRDPWIDPDGLYLYFAADDGGIFNIWRMAFETGNFEQLTSVPGGAFMPHVFEDKLYFAEYRSEGYAISRTNLLTPLTATDFGRYAPPYPDDDIHYTISDQILALNVFDDRDIQPLNTSEMRADGVTEFNLPTRFASDRREWRPYTETITGFSFFPVVRFDNYTKLNGSNSSLLKAGQFGSLGENLWRDIKIGTYFASRDVTEKLSLFGGALIGLGSRPADGISDFVKPSRIIDLDRDLFLIVEHRGLPFIKKSWSPTVAVEFYNLKRNVKDGLSIEEFPCTACLPETTSANIRYDIWQADVYFRSKLNRWSLLELGVSYSPYRVATDGFFSRELQQFIPGSTAEYFKGTTLSASWYGELIEPTRHYDIAPVGLRGQFSYRYQPGRLLDEYEINDGILSPVYNTTKNHSLELKGLMGFSLGGHKTAMITTRAFAYLNNPDDYFYLDYAGGLLGLRSYPFFAVGGTRTVFSRLSYITPLYESIYKQAGPYTIDKVFAHLFIETGNGWGGPLNIGDNLKTGIGGELRVALNGYYLFPLKLFVSGSYGLNKFNVNLSDDFITGTGSNRVTYGREFLLYFGLTFDFNLL